MINLNAIVKCRGVSYIVSMKWQNATITTIHVGVGVMHMQTLTERSMGLNNDILQVDEGINDR